MTNTASLRPEERQVVDRYCQAQRLAGNRVTVSAPSHTRCTTINHRNEPVGHADSVNVTVTVKKRGLFGWEFADAVFFSAQREVFGMQPPSGVLLLAA